MRRATSVHVFLQNAAELRRLNARIHETFLVRDLNADNYDAWKAACQEFHSRYDLLAFPGGYRAALQSLRMGEAATLEDVLTFLEVRPYFFRSGYMCTQLLRLVGRVPKSHAQEARLQAIKECRRRWRALSAEERTRYRLGSGKPGG